MAYEPDNLDLLKANVGENGGSLWGYQSTADAAAAIIAAGYIDDGADRGMKVGDHVLIAGTDSQYAQVTVVDTSSNPAGDVTMV